MREAYCYSQARSPKDQRGSKNLPFQLWALSYLVFLPAKLLPTFFETLECLFLDFCIHACDLSFNVWMPRNIMRLLFGVPFLRPDLLRRSARSSSHTRPTLLAKMWRLVGCSKTFPNSSNKSSDQYLSEYVRRAKGKSWPFGQEIQFCPKRSPKIQKKLWTTFWIFWLFWTNLGNNGSN